MRPNITVKAGKGIEVVQKMLEEHEEVAALVLGAAANGAPGPLITHFAGSGAVTIKCPVIIVPGGLSDARIDELS